MNQPNSTKNQTTVRTSIGNLGRTIGFLNPSLVLALALPLDRKKFEVTICAKDQSQITDDVQAGGLQLPQDMIDLKTSKLAQVGSIIRRNGYYAIVADPSITRAKNFGELIDQVKRTDSGRLQALDTAYNHTRNRKAAWIGKSGSSAKLLHIDMKEVTSLRFTRKGLVALTKDGNKLYFVTWNDIDAWLDGNVTQIAFRTIGTFDGELISLSHVNEHGIVVVNSDRAKYVLDLSQVRDDGNSMAKLVKKDTTQLGHMYVGTIDGTGPAAMVDDLVDDGGQKALVNYTTQPTFLNEAQAK